MTEPGAVDQSFYAGSRILVIDGDDRPASSICDDLRRMGYDPVALASAEGALEALDEICPDLLLAEIELPGIDGFALCRILKGHPRWRDLPVVAVAVGVTPETRVRGLDCGADDVLAKPPRPDELRARIDRSLSARERMRAAAESEKALSQVVLGVQRALTASLADACDPGCGVAKVATTVLLEGSEEDRPEAVLFHDHGDREEGGSGALFRAEPRGSIQSAYLPAGESTCPDLQLPEVPWAVHNLSWSARPGGNFGPSVDRELGGVRNFVRAPVFGGWVTAFNFRRDPRRLDAQRIQGLAAHGVYNDAVSARVRESESALFATMEALARICEGEYGQAATHVQRINTFAGLLAERLGMDGGFVRAISHSAQLHDVGKIKLPQAVLSKTGPLTVDEFEVVKRHAVYGAEILGDHPRLAMAREIALAHHERWDGTGYPEGRVGESIPLPARIVAVADVYDALRTRRPYREPLGHDAARDIITRGDWKTSPEQFDPAVLDAFMDVEPRFEEQFENFSEVGQT